MTTSSALIIAAALIVSALILRGGYSIIPAQDGAYVLNNLTGAVERVQK